MNDPAFERHFSIDELARLWHRSRETVRQWIKDEPGVLVQRGPGGKAAYSVPESVARRIHAAHTNPLRKPV
ncbi:MAG: hypothetical protein ABI759_11860 [Candidatus Solibacter sp.]